MFLASILFQLLAIGSIKDNLCVSLLNSILPSCNGKFKRYYFNSFLAIGSIKITFVFLALIFFCLLAIGSIKDNFLVSLFDYLSPPEIGITKDILYFSLYNFLLLSSNRKHKLCVSLFDSRKGTVA
jgi:nitrate reductase NapE component